MQLHDITRTAARVQHAVDALAATAPWGDGVDAAIAELRLAAVEHAAVVATLLDAAQLALGTPAEVRVLSELLDVLLARAAGLRAALRDAQDDYPVACTAAVVDELFAWERALLCSCGTILFPAEAG